MIERYRDPTCTQEIDGIAYTSTKFPATAALGLLSRVVKAIGEHGLRALVAANREALAPVLPRLAAQAKAQVYAAAVQIAYGLGEDLELPRALCAKLKASQLRPTVQGGPVGEAFDAHFAGELPHLVRVLAFVLLHNFAGFTLGSHLTAGSPGTPETDTDEPSSSPAPSRE